MPSPSSSIESSRVPDLRITIETPENVVLSYHLAGPAVRAVAYGIDLITRILLVAVLSVGLAFVGLLVPGVSIGVWLVVLFLVQWFYYPLCEGAFRGKTLGKRATGLRVIEDGGYPISWWGAVLRNFLRTVDGMPLGYAVGLVSMVLSGRFQRLGDLAAQTLVIHERPVRLPLEPLILERIAPLPRGELGGFVPPAQTLALIEQFLGRRHVLTHERGHAMALVLARVLARRLAYTGDSAQCERYPMAFLARVYATFWPLRETEGDASVAPEVDYSREIVDKREFIRRRRPAWVEFERLTRDYDRQRLRRARPRELWAFSRMFRERSYDLAVVRSRDWGNALAQYLNNLVSRGHNVFYRAPPGRLSRWLHFLTTEFPRTFRKNIGYFAVAAALFFAPLAITWALVAYEPLLAEQIVDKAQLDQIAKHYGEPDDSAPSLEAGDFGMQRSAMAGFYVLNNVSIAFRCFASGILLGVGTVYILLFNGITIGAIAGHVTTQASPRAFLSFVVSHGSFELTAIAVAGGAGLLLGNALLHPGQRTRLEALWTQGREALQIALGAGAMLLIAALIEAFWSPAPIPPVVKFGVGGGLWLLVALYLTLAGRGDSR